jgi:kynurenine formamidase
MPAWAGHPPLQVVTYRSPQGLRNQGDQPQFTEGTRVPTAIISDMVIAGMHTGAHIDALCHVTSGDDDAWHGGFSASQHLGDFGALRDDASQLPAIVARGVLIDCARHAGVSRLGPAHPITLDEFESARADQGVEIRAGDVVLIRTGQMSVWPDRDAWDQARGAGITLPVSERLVGAGVIAIGADTEAVEVTPSVIPGDPQPVHVHALVEHGVHLLEDLYLEELGKDQVNQFLLIVAPPKITGATGSFIRPLAIV